MDTEFLSFFFNVFLFVGVIIAIQDRGRINELLNKIEQLQQTLNFQTNQIEKLKGKLKELTPVASESSEVPKQQESHHKEKLIAQLKEQVETESKPITQEGENPWQERQQADNKAAIAATKESTSQQISKTSFSFDDLLKGNGIFWLGALVLAIGGVFLAKYSIEAGLLPPSVRVIMGSIFGIGLVVGAEWVNRHKEKLKVHTPYISAALASGGVITCFAMALVSFDFYQFITANIAFALLALISLASTYLALRFGPLLAGVGIIGAYAVPALVSTGSNNVFALLIYVAFVSLSAVWVAEHVKQKWLWWQSFVGHFIWLVVAIAMANKGDFAVLILFAVFTLYLYVLVGLLGWKLSQTMVDALPVKALLMPRKEQAVILLTLFFTAIHLTIYNEFSHFIWASLLLSVVAMLVAFRHSALDSWPFLMLLFSLFAFAVMPSVIDFSDHLFPFTGKYLFVQASVVIAMVFSLFMVRRFTSRNAYLLLLVLAPISLFGISYVSAAKSAELYLYPVWVVEMLIIATIAGYGAMKTKVALRQVTYLVLANAMLTLSLTMLLSASTLTLAIAMQVASMSYLSWKYRVRLPDWIYKLALVAVVTRLTLAPWVADYSDETIFNVHWTLIIYPAVLAIVWFATKYNPSKQLNQWFTGVFIHIVALLVTTETSYLLIGQYPDLASLSYQEAVILSVNWLVLSGVYLWRSKLTQSLSKLYQIAAGILIAGASLLHLDISLLNNPFIERQLVGEGVINWTLLQWLVPAIVLYLFTKFKLLKHSYNSIVYGVIGVFSLFFVNAEIRNAFNAGYVYIGTGVEQAELYTYSIVWLVISTVAIFVAQHYQHKTMTNLGFIGLALVILKAFGIDMSHLEGLLRALSFIGLGLSLVGIGWLFQKVQNKPKLAEQ